MAKKKQKKAKLPKRILGVKIPKALRTQGDSLAGFMQTPMGRQVVADALVAMAGALLGSKATREAVAQAGSNVAEAGSSVAHTARDATQGTAHAARDLTEVATGVVAEAVRHILPSSLTGGEDEGHKDRRTSPENLGPLAANPDAEDKRSRHRDKPSKH